MTLILQFGAEREKTLRAFAGKIVKTFNQAAGEYSTAL